VDRGPRQIGAPHMPRVPKPRCGLRVFPDMAEFVPNRRDIFAWRLSIGQGAKLGSWPDSDEGTPRGMKNRNGENATCRAKLSWVS